MRKSPWAPPFVSPRKVSDGAAPTDLFGIDETRPRAELSISMDSEGALFIGLEVQDQAELRLILEEEKALLEQERILEEKLKRQLAEEAAGGSET